MSATAKAGPTTPRPGLPARAALALAAALLCALALASAAQGAVPRTFFGVSAVRPTPADFSRMGELGAGAYRVEIAWPAVQTAKDAEFNWNGVDERFRRAATFGLRPEPIIFGTPGFISGDGSKIRGPVHTAEQRQEWQDFAAAVLGRYGPGGDFWVDNPTLDATLAPNDWIIWNEQNARAFWHPKVSPREYAALLRITRAAFDTVNPTTKMTVGGMYGFPIHPKAQNAKRFLKSLYRQRKAKQLIDGVSAHPYAGKIGGVKRQTRALRRVMNKAGDRRASLYIGETGWASAGKKKGSFGFLVKSKRRQAALLERAYKFFLNKRRKWRIRGVAWFTFRDYTGAEVCGWCPKAGLLNRRSQLKPSGEAYAALISKKVG